MFATIDLGRLRQDRATAVAHQPVDRRTERRVGADARITVRAAALQAHGDVARAHRLALDAVGFLQQALDELHTARHRLCGAPGVLDAEGMQARTFGQTLLRHQALNLVGLAAEPDHQHRGEVGMLGIATQRAAQHQQLFAVAGGGAALSVGQRDDAVDVRIVGQRLGVDVAAELISDRPRRGGRAVDAGQHADVVARRDAAIVAHDAHEGGGLVHVRGGVHAGAHLVCALEGRERQVVRVHVLARCDGLRRESR